MVGRLSFAEARYRRIAQRNAVIFKRLADGDDPDVVAGEAGVSRRRLLEIARDNLGDTIAIPAWVPACLHEEYRAVAEEDGEEDAASWARNEKRKMASPRAVVIEPDAAPALPPAPEPAPAEDEPIVPLAPGARQYGYAVKPTDKLYAISDLLRVAAKAGGVSVRDLKEHSRSVGVVRPRQVFFWLAHRHTSLGYPGIGRACGGRDHTTVLYGVRKIDHVLSLTGLAVVEDPAEMARALLSFRWPDARRPAR